MPMLLRKCSDYSISKTRWLLVLFLISLLWCSSTFAKEKSGAKGEDWTKVSTEVFRLEFVPRSGDASFLQVLPVVLPYSLPKLKADELPMEGKEHSKKPVTWSFPVQFLTKSDGIAVLFDKQATKSKERKAALVFPVELSENSFLVTAVDRSGKISEYELKVRARRTDLAPVKGKDVAQGIQDPNGFWVVGPVFYSRQISRTGAALPVTGSTSSSVVGVRAIGRYRLLKNLTQSLPGDIKLFGDLNVALAKSLSGAVDAAGMPRWIDLRVTADFYHVGRFRFEAGAGFSHYAPSLTTEYAGDLRKFLGFLLSLRVGTPIWNSVTALGGVNFALPSSQNTDQSTLVSQPFDAFFSISVPVGSKGFVEGRFRYYRIKTTGTVVSSGAMERVESFVGPELLWVGRF